MVIPLLANHDLTPMLLRNTVKIPPPKIRKKSVGTTEL